MSKRRLSKQQKDRIAENQRKELTQKSAELSSSEHSAEQNCNGRVISHFGQQLEIESLLPQQQGRIVRCHQRANLPKLVTGDLVVWEEDGSDTGIIVAAGERQNLFARPSSASGSARAGDLKPIAANIDLVLVIFSVLPEPFMNLIDRYLVAIECLGLQPQLVLNKVDLLENTDSSDLDSMLSIYQAIGYNTLRVSAVQGQGMAELEQSLAGKTAVLVGQSGVGKSSLINKLGLHDMALVGELSQGKSKGTHTTTTARLFHLASFDLIDSPGIRKFGLGHIDQQQLIDGFIELRALSGQCKFRDCAHQSEPECAIRDAVARGEVHQRRLDSYFQILKSMENP